MFDSPMTPKDSNNMSPRENENSENTEVIHLKDDSEVEGTNHQLPNVDVVQGIPLGLAENTNNGIVQGIPHESDDDAEFAELSILRCTSIRTEEIADREKRKQQRRTNRCADYPGLAFGSAAFGSETMMKFNIIKNELHNIMRSQLKRVDGEVSAMSQRIKALDENLAKSEQYIKTATAALAEAVAMEVERRKNAGEDEENGSDDSDPLSQFDAQMTLLEGKLLEAKYLAAKANNTSNRILNSPPKEEKEEPDTETKTTTEAPTNNENVVKVPPIVAKPTTLRRPFPTTPPKS